ncbi:MAG: hypothetical protein M3445_09480 [Actinomycetota bacterium]|nr:hypothetical protein [Actinomycetota bacterium]
MNTATKVAGFVAALAATFGITWGIGNAVGPLSEPALSRDAGHDADHEGGTPSPGTEPAAETPGGLMVSQNGYTLRVADQQAAAGDSVDVAFTIGGPDGRPVTAYDVEHEKLLHLIAVRRDFTGFQHVHPELGSNGVWTTQLDLTSGQWRLFADFKATDADPLTLGADLAVGGVYEPATASTESRTAKVDGYTVNLEGDLEAGTDAELTLSISRDGEPVTDLEPYLGAYGHLVALRGGDLAYLHVHPDGTPGDDSTQPGPDVVFYAGVPSRGAYHLYLDFKHQGVVRTAEFTVAAGDEAKSGEEHGDDDAHDH